MSTKSPFDIEAFMAEQGLEPCPRCSLPDSPMRWKVYHTPEHPCPHDEHYDPKCSCDSCQMARAGV